MFNLKNTTIYTYIIANDLPAKCLQVSKSIFCSKNHRLLCWQMFLPQFLRHVWPIEAPATQRTGLQKPKVLGPRCNLQSTPRTFGDQTNKQTPVICFDDFLDSWVLNQKNQCPAGFHPVPNQPSKTSTCWKAESWDVSSSPMSEALVRRNPSTERSHIPPNGKRTIIFKYTLGWGYVWILCYIGSLQGTRIL